MTAPVDLRVTDPSSTLAAVDELLRRRTTDLAALLHAETPAPSGPLDVDLAEELLGWLAVPGKRLRPVAAHWGWVAAAAPDGRGRDELVVVGAALELLHLFALVHDDVMDGSSRRRGVATLHARSAEQHRRSRALGDADRFGEAVAVLFGDLLLAEASDLVASTGPAVREHWRTMVVELVRGQQLDVTGTAARARSAATSQGIGRLKSGRYTVRRPVELGALVAGADPRLVGGLGTWGDLVGDAFALRDDVIGVWGDPDRSGKSATEDLRAAKPTLLLTWATEVLDGPARHLLEACDAGRLGEDSARALAAAMRAAGLRDRAEARIDDLLDEADRVLTGLSLEGEARTGLDDMARSAGRRRV